MFNFLRSSKCVGNFHLEPRFGLHKRKWPGQITVRNVPQRSRGTLVAWQWYAVQCSTQCSTDVGNVCIKWSVAFHHGLTQAMFHVEQMISKRSIKTIVLMPARFKQAFELRMTQVVFARAMFAWIAFAWVVFAWVWGAGIGIVMA